MGSSDNSHSSSTTSGLYDKDVFQFYNLKREGILAETKCIIYLAHLTLDKSVKKVVKVSRRDEKSTKRFFNELSLLKSLQHPNIMAFEKAGSFSDHHAIIMPYCDGGALYSLIGKMTIGEIEDYFLQMCGGLKYLHSRGIVHRDIKLDNILVNGSQILITDFDMSSGIIPGTSLVRHKMGTEPYMAPEMIANPKGYYDGFKLDAYALGVVLWCMLFEKDVQNTEDYLAVLTVKPSQLGVNDALRLCTDTTDIDIIIDLTRHFSPQVRQRALREMCPCRVQKDITAFWNRVFEMLQDTNENVRYQVLHTLCDGSPVHLENEIAEALDVFNRDPSPKIRRQAHRALASYRRTGKWNIL